VLTSVPSLYFVVLYTSLEIVCITILNQLEQIIL